MKKLEAKFSENMSTYIPIYESIETIIDGNSENITHEYIAKTKMPLYERL
jgi:hypothetical protein